MVAMKIDLESTCSMLSMILGCSWLLTQDVTIPSLPYIAQYDPDNVKESNKIRMTSL